MKPRIILVASIILMGLIIAAVPQDTTTPYRLTADELLAEVNSRSQFISPEAVADLIVNKDPSLQLIDVRNADEYEKFHLEGAINIPISDLLSEENADILNQDIRMNVLYSNSTLNANQAWMITRQLGYNNNYVLEGGLNYWFDVIMNPQQLLPQVRTKSLPSTISGRQQVQPWEVALSKHCHHRGSSSAVKPVIKTVKKPVVAGGC
jgi:rhodanese-related sulfurtransferase